MRRKLDDQVGNRRLRRLLIKDVSGLRRPKPTPYCSPSCLLLFYTFLAGVIPDFAGFLAVLFVAVSAQSSPQTVFASLQTLSHRGGMASSSLFAMLPLSLLGQVPRSAPVRRSWFRERDAKTKACLRATVSPAANPRGDGAAICHRRYTATTGAQQPK